VGIGLALAKAERERRERAKQRRASRHFGLLTDETGAHGLQRIALGQLDIAIELLRGESRIPPERAVHETRKALKRLRALMRLLEGEIGSKRAARARAVLREAGARLAGARDTEVMIGTLEALLSRRQSRKLDRGRGVARLREHLQREHRAAAAPVLEYATRAEVAEELCALRKRVSKWKLSDRPAGRLVRPGLEHIYRAGRAGRRRAVRRKPDSRAMHKWRKHVKDLRYALEIIDVEDAPGKGYGARPGKHAGKRPGRHASRHASKRIAKLARRADRLGELLGEEHDLMLLGELVRSYKPLRRQRRTRKRLLRAIARRRTRLRKRALREGEGLYERKPKRFVRRTRV
jgi:CHAD domain